MCNACSYHFTDFIVLTLNLNLCSVLFSAVIMLEHVLDITIFSEGEITLGTKKDTCLHKLFKSFSAVPL